MTDRLFPVEADDKTLGELQRLKVENEGFFNNQYYAEGLPTYNVYRKLLDYGQAFERNDEVCSNCSV